MGFFDKFKKKDSDPVETTVAEPHVEDGSTPQEERTQPESAEEGVGFGGMLKSGLSSMLKAVGIGGWKAKHIDDLQPNFESTDPLEHVLTMNKASKAFGGLHNLGIYADNVKVTFSHALKVTTEDDFVEITTKDQEMAGQGLPSDDSSTNPFEHGYDDLLTRECPDLGGARKPDSVIPYSA